MIYTKAYGVSALATDVCYFGPLEEGQIIESVSFLGIAIIGAYIIVSFAAFVEAPKDLTAASFLTGRQLLGSAKFESSAGSPGIPILENVYATIPINLRMDREKYIGVQVQLLDVSDAGMITVNVRSPAKA